MNRKTNFIFVCLVVLLLLACSERFTAYYPTYEDALKDGAIKRGWIPDIVPITATEIYEQHDIDTNDVWIRFTISSSYKDRITAWVKKLTDSDISKLRVRHPSKTDWWFEGLVQQSPANDNALNAEIYTMTCYENKTGYIAFDRTSQKVYYWCTI